MALKIVPHNFVERVTGQTAITSQQTIDADYPLAGLYDGRTSPVCLWDDAVALPAIDLSIPLSVLINGGFESASLADWEQGTGGTFTRVNTTPAEGSWCLEVDANGCHVQAQQAATVYASHRYEFRAKTRSATGGATIAKVGLVDLEGGGLAAGGGGFRYLNASGQWVDAPTWLGTTNADAWTTVSVQFRMPSFAEWGRPSGRVLVILDADGDVCRFDGISLAPAVDVVGLVGHNLHSSVALGLYDGADYTTANRVGIAAPAQPVAFMRLAQPLYAPTVSVAGVWPSGQAAHRIPFVGELYVGQSVDLRAPRVGLVLDYAEEQIRLSGRGHLSTYRDAHYPQRNPTIALDFPTAAERVAARDEWMLATEFGSRPHLILPSPSGGLAEVCIFGTVEPNFSEDHLHADIPYVSSEYRVRELPIVRFEAPTRTPSPASCVAGTVRVLVRRFVLGEWEPYLGGDAIVELRTDPGGDLIDTQTTDGSGYATFTGIAPQDVSADKTDVGWTTAADTGTVVAGVTLDLVCDEELV